ncbi:MAG: stage II sporulation protein R, partial [Oscillospiraceae bacterium]
MFNKSRVFAVFTCLALIFSIWLTYAQNVNDDIAGSVLRLHIIANSDTTPDQMLKIKVRDRVLSDCGHLFKNA